MSHAYYTYAYMAPSAEVPKIVSSENDLRALSNSAYELQQKNPLDLVTVSGLTRGGWAIYTTDRMIEALSLPSLSFLGAERHQYVFADEHGSTSISIIKNDEFGPVLADFDRLFSALSSDPEILIDADMDGCCTVEDMASELARNYVSTNPAFDRNIRDDEGQGASYLIVYLRSVQALLKSAYTNKCAVIHMLKI